MVNWSISILNIETIDMFHPGKCGPPSATFAQTGGLIPSVGSFRSKKEILDFDSNSNPTEDK